MASLNETDLWEPGIYQLEEDDPVLGGPQGIDNLAPRQLASRSRYQRLRSVTPWDIALPYPEGAYAAHGGKTWRSLAPSTGVQPGSDATKWERWGFTASEMGAEISAHEAKEDPHTQYVKVAGDEMQGPLLLQAPAQFDQSAQAATAAHVQRALGSNAGFRLIAVSTALTHADIGKMVACSSLANPVVVTLPPVAGLPPGAVVEISALAGTLGVTIQPAGAERIYFVGNTPAVTPVMRFGDTARLLWTGFEWDIVGGSLQLKYSAPFGAQLSASWYQLNPSGLLVQGGTATTTSSGVTVNFPVAFPGAVLGVNLTVITNSGAGAFATSFPPALTGMYVQGWSTNATQIATTVSWTAWGK
ncbi:hypothetical protein ABID97_003020 [Variovorax sp. OAS795]|uniref:gp53-like domain-containing protein n=1 Tax=Variovorax sp. OAS795 TaxID=3034231 RepID=UPI0033955F36